MPVACAGASSYRAVLSPTKSSDQRRAGATKPDPNSDQKCLITCAQGRPRVWEAVARGWITASVALAVLGFPCGAQLQRWRVLEAVGKKKPDVDFVGFCSRPGAGDLIVQDGEIPG